MFGQYCHLMFHFSNIFLVDFPAPIICNRLASVAGPRGSGRFRPQKKSL